MTALPKEWMLGLPGHADLVDLDEIVLLIRGGQLRETDMVKRAGEPWRNASEVSELATYFPSTGHAQRESRNRGGKATHTRRAKMKAPPPEAKSAPLESPPTAMADRYFSPTDLLRGMTHALTPRKIVAAGLLLVPAAIVASMANHIAVDHVLRESLLLGRAVQGIAALILACGIAASTSVLAFMTRRQIEGSSPSLAVSFRHLFHRASVLVLPLIAAAPIGLLLALLAILGWVRNSGETMAGFLRFVYVLPFALGILAVVMGVFLQLLLMMLPAGCVAEEIGLREATKVFFYYLRSQTGRLLMDWLWTTLIVGLSYFLCSRLLGLAYALAEWAAPRSDTGLVNWYGNRGIHAFYEGLRDGLALVLPASLFATMSFLSYLTLRQEDIAITTEGDTAETTITEREEP